MTETVDIAESGATAGDRGDDPNERDPDSTAVDPERVELLFVVIDGERYAIERGRLRRVVEPSPVTRVPRTPEMVRGVTQIGGEVAAVVDARRLFDRPAGDVETGRFVLLERGSHETALALHVDAVETFEPVHVSRISVDADEELIRATVDADDGGAGDAGSAGTDENAGDDDPAATGGSTTADESTEGRPTPIVDVGALFEAATA